MKNRDKKVKLLFILPALVSGGAERVLINLMNAVDREKYDPSFLSVRFDGELGGLIAQDIPRYCLNASRFIFCLPGLYKTMRKVKPDIVVSTMAHMNFAVLLMKPLFPRAKFLVREAITPSYFIEKYPHSRWFLKALYRLLYPLSHRVISPTEIIFQEFEAMFGKGWMRPYLLRNPINVIKIREAAERDWPVEKKAGVNFVACGRLVPQKGFDRLISSLAKNPPLAPWHLTIIGEGPERTELQNLVNKAELQDKISLPGLKVNPYGYFAAADCFLLPSRFEGLPNVVLESLACGTPVIATQESGGITEIAFVVNSENKKALTVVENMDYFEEAIIKVTSLEKHTPAASLLPAEFERETIIRRFHTLLSETATG
ncbi:MAG TPA: glycosyltransferase [Micavibrio sp.]|nr:glycosyltransferase [Micavibrio sp.]